MIKDEKKVLFSIVVPVWNRQDVIGCCLDSVFSQDFDDYEVIVVDDTSDDNTVSVIQGYKDVRLKLIRHVENRGACAARNTGTVAAAGEWVVYLDSDDAFLPEALSFLAQMASKAPLDVGVVAGSAIRDEGKITPDGSFPNEPFGFIEYLKYWNSCTTTDYQACIRRKVFEDVSWPTDLRLETQFHIKVFKKWKLWLFPKVITKIFTDCANRSNNYISSKALNRLFAMAPFLALDYEEILTNFGTDLKNHAPKRYWDIAVNAAKYNFLAGRRLRGLKFGLRAWLHRPWFVKMLFIIGGGLLFGPKAWVWISRFRSSLQNRSGKFLR